ncbi:MAG: DMT family transporter [Salibacteraceae bacterium]
MIEWLRRYKNYLYLHGIVIIFGFTAILGELITLSTGPKVLYRMGIGFFGILLFLLFRRKSIRVGKKQLFQLLGAGVVIALHWILFFEAIEVSNVSVTLAAISSASLFTAILEPIVYRRKVIGYEVALSGLVIVGLGVIFQVEGGYRLGMFYGIVSAFLASLFTVINGRLVKQHDASTISMYELLGGFLAIGIYFVCTGGLSVESFSMTTTDLIYMLILGLICTSLAFVGSVAVMKEIPPFSVSMAINMEPIYGILLALVIFGSSEFMSPMFYVGALLVLLSVFGNAYLKNKKKRSDMSPQAAQ